MHISITNQGIHAMNHKTALLRIINILMNGESNISSKKWYEFLNPCIIGKAGNGCFRMHGERMCDSSKVKLKFVGYETREELPKGNR